MVRIYIKVGILVFLFFINSLGLNAQKKLGFPVVGNIISETGPTENARATIFEDGREIQVIGIDGNGKFNLTFLFNHDYILVLSGDERFQKKIQILTFVPTHVLNSSSDFPPYVLEQSLFKEITGIDKSFSDNIIIKLFYDPGVDNFISEVFYNDGQIQKQIENAIWRSQQVGKTADELARLTDAELRLMRQEYNQWIKEAAFDYQEARYQAALMGYKAANRLFPEEQFPIDRIAEINDLLLALQITANLDQVQEEKFRELINQADAEFNSTEYDLAKGLYRQALNIKINDSHAISRIQEIDKILAVQIADSEYADIIEEADRLFVNSNLEVAKTKYNEALILRPKEDYPKRRLKDIEDEEDRLEKNELQLQRYQLAIAEGDEFREKTQYLRARETYEWAMSFKPGDEIAQERISQIDELMRLEKIDKDYEKLITDADKSFKKEDYSKAVQSYNEALLLKPDEEYPQNQVAIINNILENDNARILADQQYQAKIKEADGQFVEKNYSRAKNFYSEALLIKSDEKYPTDKIAEIDRIVAEIEKQKLEDEKYNELITLANAALDISDYQTAKTHFDEAREVKPRERYPVQKVDEIETILKNISEAEENYRKAISEADKNYNRELYTPARTFYSQALSFKSGQEYPEMMILRIDSVENAMVLAQKAELNRLDSLNKEKDKNYNELIAAADINFNSSQFEEARVFYEKALEIKSDEAYPKQRLEAIKDIINKLADQKKEYEKLIAEADKQFEKELFVDARESYLSAKSSKPDEIYPDEMVSKIDSIVNARTIAQKQKEAEQKKIEEAQQTKLIADQEILDRNYNQAITQADNFYNSDQYQSAIDSYKEAQNLKPGEIYPEQRIIEIEGILADILINDQGYTKSIADADKAFEKQNYDEAKMAYNNALVFKPQENYPKNQLIKISEIVEQLARDTEKELNYQNAITEGDGLFGKNSFNQAISAYRQALTFKPEEKYPQDQIRLADARVEEQEKLANLEKSYSDAINAADAAFNNADYENAEKGYNNAIRIKPNEKYPKERLNLIVGQIKDEIMRERYNVLITEGDKLFNLKEYYNSRDKYFAALVIIAGDEYAQNRIDEIDAILAALAKAEEERKELERKYAQAIIFADKEFTEGGYPDAVKYYNEALSFKPDEIY
ncbi:MAG: hypothetical protein HQ541_11500, partial [Mariniphaga sp.]|nr:hypothetical protein [Mariniphaga sp.]